MRVAVVGHVVRRDDDRRIRLADDIGDCRGSDIVIVGSAGEAPGVTRICPGRDVARVTHVDSTDRDTSLAVYTADRGDSRGVCVAIIGYIVGRDYDHCGGLVDFVGDRGGSNVVVVGSAGEAPGVSPICPGRGVGRIAHVDSTHRETSLAVYTGD